MHPCMGKLMQRQSRPDWKALLSNEPHAVKLNEGDFYTFKFIRGSFVLSPENEKGAC